MTDTREDELFDAVWKAKQARQSPEHAEDVQKAADMSATLKSLEADLAEVQSRVSQREAAEEQARAALREYHIGLVDAGDAEPADNIEAAAVIEREDYFSGFENKPWSETESSRGTGGLSNGLNYD